MDRRQVLVAVSGAQLLAGIAGQLLAAMRPSNWDGAVTVVGAAGIGLAAVMARLGLVGGRGSRG